jgi:glycosyltransferase involved in cell wall biosynthesis
MAGVCPDATSHEKVRSLTVFFPAFNDAHSLPELIAGAFEVLRRRVPDHEVIVINDGSADRTAEVLDELRQQYGPRLRIVTHPVNLGYGAALRSGFEAATKDWIFYTDGDGQYDPTELDLLLDVTDGKTGLVNGYKVHRHDPWHRKVIGSIYNTFARALFRIQIRDIDCDFRLIRRDLVTDVDLRSTSGTICLETGQKA